MMNSNNLIRTFFILGLMFFVLLAEAQRQDGHIVLESGEKLEGRIRTGALADFSERIRFESKSGESRDYTPREVKEVVYTTRRGETYEYVKRDLNGRETFVHRVIQGDTDLYLYFEQHPINRNRIAIYWLYGPDGRQVKVKEDNYLRFLKEYFSDCPTLKGQLGTDGHKFTNMADIVDKYNRCWKTSR